ncbi:Putative adenosylhomocysteinase [Candidatus Bealeia paramacronuclearis]|uniref:Adenosylhomocysteinase n=1 Tax=Candidatus Bealeia paramacronuclearis TaxID=1921001 RepID=A0ABZ2C6N5_9PROT|nr:putative adenosylhomocysteinase [Candidatus Bealeia paramacronuclearis]
MTAILKSNTLRFQEAWDHYNPGAIPFLLRDRERFLNEKPYRGLKILHNTPLSLDATCKIQLLLMAGADVTVTCVPFLRPQTQPLAEEILYNEGVPLIVDHNNISDDFDVILDCSAVFAGRLTPRLGAVELTQSGTNIYKVLNPQSYKVISVDDSRLKGLETFYGTGSGFLNGFSQFANESVASQEFLIFGYGKVGQGVAHFLKESGAYVTVVDVDFDRLAYAQKRGIRGISFEAREKILDAIQNSFAVVTATAILGFISKYFTANDFRCVKYLANIGAEDEWGDQFESAQILNHKSPVNFGTPEPTPMKYLEAIFHAHNSAIDLLLDTELKNGYHGVPQDWDLKILSDWCQFHNVEIEDVMKELGNI